MIDVIDEIAFRLWATDVGTQLRADWSALDPGHQDKYQRMAVQALRRMRELGLTDFVDDWTGNR